METVKHGRHREARKLASEMAKSKKRDVRRKGLRLLREASRNIVRESVKAERASASVVALRREGNTIFGMRTGLFGHPTTTVLRVPDETVVGAIEDAQELGSMVTQVGMLVMASLFNYNLAFGVEGLAKKMAAWAGIDVEALKKAAEEEVAETEKAQLAAEGKVIEVDEDGDEVVRPVSEDGDSEARIHEQERLAVESGWVDLGGES
jgi:hypothetical protein